MAKAQIYDVPDEVNVPKIKFGNFNLKEYQEEVEKFYKDLKQHLLNLGWVGEHVGEVIRFPVADGYAEYMVFDLNPVRLVHIPLGDAWHFEYVHLLTKTEVLKKIQQQKALAELFGKKEVK